MKIIELKVEGQFRGDLEGAAQVANHLANRWVPNNNINRAVVEEVARIAYLQGREDQRCYIDMVAADERACTPSDPA